MQMQRQGKRRTRDAVVGRRVDLAERPGINLLKGGELILCDVRGTDHAHEMPELCHLVWSESITRSPSFRRNSAHHVNVSNTTGMSCA